MFHFHSPDWLSLFQDPQYPHHPPDFLLSPCSSRLCSDLEKFMVSPCCLTCGGVFNHWILWSRCESDHHDWDGQRRWADQEVLYGCHDFRCVLCWEYRWTAIDQVSDEVKTLS
jgi:hypothetical protein